MRSRGAAVAAAFAVALVGVTASPAAAAPDDFSCRASALRVQSSVVNSEAIVANRPGNPCRDDFNQLAGITLPNLVRSGVLNAATDSRDDGSSAAASVNNTVITLGNATIAATVLASNASATCTAGKPAFSGGSTVLGLVINGRQVVNANQTVTIPVNPLVTVVINERVQSGNVLTTRALRVTSPLLGINIVVAESVANVNRCPQPPKPECSDGVDNGDPEDPLPDAQDPGCHTDGNAKNPASYDPNDPSETNTNECSDGKDNDGDQGIDATGPHPDPQCADPEDALESA